MNSEQESQPEVNLILAAGHLAGQPQWNPERVYPVLELPGSLNRAPKTLRTCFQGVNEPARIQELTRRRD